MLREVADSLAELSGDRDICVIRCENWDIFIFQRDLVEHGARLSWSNCVAQHNICSTRCEVTVCGCVHILYICLCVFQYD